ncbi:hypothetical protein PsYK624_120020 [Phanerochaete sordida]|uniref:Bromodomain associated domain-containing protein n=1 Tax=Phanerochaete sordida TaxID=48140 RepID=A0A9P3GHP9_9APHY|nr:hypothetical protein PsYK624_120020 [Phanerochaete sordida]
MDAGARKLLETATVETLHAHHFSKASTQATNVLTDLLSRYLQVLASTCVKYAEHAGRLRLTARDAACALDELGVGVEELNEYCATEGKELARYAVHTARRLEDLSEFRAALSIGLREDRDDAMHLVYMPIPEDMPTDEEVSEEDESESEAEVPPASSSPLSSQHMNVDVPIPEGEAAHVLEEQKNGRISSPRPLTPTLPLSPISNPSTPPRKRPRTSGWSPPAHIPDFLPPFPSHTPQRTPSPPPLSLPPAMSSMPMKPERPITPPPDVAFSTADYKNAIPYSMSVIASQPTTSLPARPISPASPPPPQHALPDLQQSLYSAYHYALTHPPPKELGPTNPARYKVAVALIEESQKNPRWEPAPSLYGISSTNAPRVSSIGPWYPIALDDKSGGKGKDAEEPGRFPPAQPRPIMYSERVAPLVSQQGSRIPALAQKVLPTNVLRRTTRLAPPPPLVQDGRRLTYGPGVSAPWNSGPAPPAQGAPNGVKDAKKEKGDAPPPKVVPDAKLYATWNWEQKTFRDAVRRPRVGSVSLSGTIGNGRRRSESHVER